jgi:hypothetical protein
LDIPKNVLGMPKKLLVAPKSHADIQKRKNGMPKKILVKPKEAPSGQKTFSGMPKNQQGVYIIMGNKDYVPANDEEFLDWGKNLYAYALAHYAGWDIPSPQVSLETLLNAYEAAFHAANSPNRGKVDILHKNQTRNALKKEIRLYVRAYLINNPAVTDEDKTAMGLPIYKTTHTPVPVPSTAPRLFLNTSVRRRISVDYRDEGSGRRGKPSGVHGIEVRWAILDHPPASISELVRSAFDTRSPLTLEFEEHERGKRVYMCGRWEIQREGEKGPWGDIVEAIIP